MRFWDSSGIVPLLIAQELSPRARQLFTQDSELVVWWGARVECVSALARLEREKTVTPEGANRALARLQEFSKIWDEVQPTDRLRSRAERLLRAHQLRAADSLQLSAMLELAGDAPLATEMVCFDDRLSAAARREGLQVATR